MNKVTREDIQRFVPNECEKVELLVDLINKWFSSSGKTIGEINKAFQHDMKQIQAKTTKGHAIKV